MTSKLIVAAFILAFCSTGILATEQGDDNPTGVSGTYNGQISTGGLYDPYTGNATRVVDDIVVPGSLGAYPLKLTRYFNSHVTFNENTIGGQWRFSYVNYKIDGSDMVATPDGRKIGPANAGSFGVEESLVSPYPYTTHTLYLADGGRVIFNNLAQATQLIDPYGLVTTLTYVLGKLDKITEPGGRYLKLTYTSSLLTKVEAFDGVNPQATQSVTYTWSNFTYGNGTIVKVLTRADYSDGSFATYTYADRTYQGAPDCTHHTYPRWHAAVLATADDVRYSGPMRQIAYEYYSGTNGNNTRVLSEKNFVTGEAVSTVTGVSNDGTQAATETRGDGPTRAFHYYKTDRCMDCPPPDTEMCTDPTPTDGKLKDFTDFLGHTTTLTYESNDAVPSAGFVTAVQDVNQKTTTYTRQTGSWGITQITFPPTPSEPNGSSIQQSFWPAYGHDANSSPWFLASRTDERGNTTVYTRDANNRVTRKDYPTPDARAGLDPAPAAVYETFSYNNFNEVLTHRMTNGAYQYSQYDARGLLVAKTNPTWTYYNYDVNNLGNFPASEPKTTFTYYTSGPWTDRIQTVTYPANASSAVATETYEYDRAYDTNGENSGASQAQAAVAGRGLVTRITHADAKFQSFSFDKYGNKLWQKDELLHKTSMTYDAYKRVLTITDPLNRTVTNNYVPTGKTSSWITTSNLPFYTTLPSTKKTTFFYDANWRKTRVQQAPGTGDEANTYFTYDNIGNQLTVQDPRTYTTTNVYDARNRLTSTSDALTHTTSFTYDAHGNRLTTTKANGEIITNVYDKLNRVIQVQTKRDATTTDIRNYVFDAAGNQTKFQDENATARGDTANLYLSTYDFANRLTMMTYPNGKHEDTSYDNAGNTVTYKNRAGITKTFSQFDNRNRSRRFDWSDSTPWQTTNYDDASRITQIANSVSTINNVYLDDNRLSTQEEWTSAFNDNVHRTVTYTYDVDGNRLTVQYPSGTAFNYTYTNRNQVASIKPGLSGGTAVVSYTFDASGNITNRALDNGTSTAYTVDQVNRDSAVVHALVGTTRRFDYAYNSVNDVTTVERDGNLNDADAYSYDLTQQVLGYAQRGTLSNGTVTNPQTNTALTFDGCGNDTSLSVNGGASGTFAVDYLNEYTTFNNAAVTNDDDGDVLTYDGWIYTYDAQNRLIAASKGTTSASFVYDGLNRQVARSMNGNITFSVWDGDWAVLEEYGPSNAIQQKYLQGYHGLVKTLQNNIYYYQDELGSTSHIANASGGLIESYQYKLYGLPQVYDQYGVYQPNATPVAKDLGDGGARWISELSLYDDRNRFMSPALGRFIQPDPIGFKGDASNLYRYCGNDWANRTDLNGLGGVPNNDQGDDLIRQQTINQLQAAQKALAHLKAEVSARLWSYGASVIAPLKNQINKLQENIKDQGLHGQMTQDVKTFHNWRAAGEYGGRAASPMAVGDSQHREFGGPIGESETHPGIYAIGEPRRGDFGPVNDGKSAAGRYNTTTFQKSDLPKGYQHLVGGYWALPYHQQDWPKGDRARLWQGKINGVLAIPPTRGAAGAGNSITFKYYEYVPGSQSPE